jgi:hypothetical protein
MHKRKGKGVIGWRLNVLFSVHLISSFLVKAGYLHICNCQRGLFSSVILFAVPVLRWTGYVNLNRVENDCTHMFKNRAGLL